MSAPVFKARVWEVGIVSGTGPISLPGSAAAGGYRTFYGAIGSTACLVGYLILDTANQAWEIGVGTFNGGSPGTLTRGLIESSTGALVNFFGNACNIELVIVSPVTVSAETASAGQLPALNSAGVLDPSFTPDILDINSFDLMGDSRQAYQNSPSGYQNAYSYFNQCNAIFGQKFLLKNLLATGGYRSDQYLNAYLSTAQASNSNFCIIWGIVNDILQGATTDQAWFGGSYSVGGVAVNNPGILNACQKLKTLGKKPILLAEIGQSSWSTTQIAQTSKYNQYCRELAENGGCIFIDITPAMWDPAASTVTEIVHYADRTQDTVHPNTKGSYYIAQLVGSALSFVPPLPVEPVALCEDTSSQLIYNPLFENLTGGSSSGTVTGNVPQNWILVVPSGWSVNIVSASNSDGFGNDVTFEITASNNGFVTFEQVNYLGSAGGIYQGGLDFSVASGSVNFLGADTELGAITSGGNTVVCDYYLIGTSNPVGISSAYNYTTKTPKVIVPSNVTLTELILSSVFTFSAAGSATITIRRPWLRKRYS